MVLFVLACIAGITHIQSGIVIGHSVFTSFSFRNVLFRGLNRVVDPQAYKKYKKQTFSNYSRPLWGLLIWQIQLAPHSQIFLISLQVKSSVKWACRKIVHKKVLDLLIWSQRRNKLRVSFPAWVHRNLRSLIASLVIRKALHIAAVYVPRTWRQI